MFTLISAVVLLSVLYGLAWHDEPGRGTVVMRRTNRKQEPND